MVTEPEPGFKSLVDRLDRTKKLLRNLRGALEVYRGIVAEIDKALATLDDAIEEVSGVSVARLPSAASSGPITDRSVKLEWRTIDSAPRDGATVFLWGILECSPYARPRVGCEDLEAAAYYEGAWVAQWGEGYVIDPTHWMPLPPPPQEGKDG